MIHSNAKVDVVMTYPRDIVRDESKPEISVRDRISGQMLCVLYMDAEQIVKLLTSHYQTLDAWVVPEDYIDRIGRRLVSVEREVPVSIIGRFVTAENHPDEYQAAERWADEECMKVERGQPNWECATLRHTNTGWIAIFQRWDRVTPPTLDEAEEPVR